MKKISLLKSGGALALTSLLGAVAASAATFTIGVIPDTQNYCDQIASENVNFGNGSVSVNPQPASFGIFQREMQYLASVPNLAFVTHVGDIVQNGDLYDQEWQRATNAMGILAAANIPFGLVPGNHDYDIYNHPAGQNRPLAGNAKFNQYFGPNSPFFAGQSWYGGSHTDAQGSGGTSSYQTFTAGGRTYLHISLAMEASDDTLAWASSVIASHPGFPTIVTTHEYLSHLNDANGVPILLSDGYMEPANGLTEGNNQAQAVWNKFISQNDQIFLVICGHNWSSTATDGTSDGENLRIDNNAFGHAVYEVLNDYQGNTIGPDGNMIAGGAGWMRLMTFDTVQNTIHFQTYSSELQQYAGANGASTFDVPAGMSDFTLPIPARPWKFGVLSDTQWVTSDDGKSPESLPASMVQQIDQNFIAQNVKLVIAVGDTVDNSTPASQATRALYSQDLYNAGIAFYPLRGNHDAELLGSGESFGVLYPQIVNGGSNNLTPAWDTPSFIINSLFGPADESSTYKDTPSVLATDFSTGVPPATPSGSAFQLGTNFSYPTANCPLSGPNADLANVANYPGAAQSLSEIANYSGVTANNGISYAFDYNNVRFMLLDQFTDVDPGGNTSTIGAQQPWITQEVSDSARPAHALVFTHKMLLGGNHKDNLFGANINGPNGNDAGDGAFNTNGMSASNLAALTAKQQIEDAFISALATNNVRYVISGHDHHHKNSLVRSPLNPNMSVKELIAQSDSNKFYTPSAPFSTNEISISEDLWEVGNYICTVDGPRLTIDYYAVPTYASGNNVPVTPALTGNWAKMLTLGYSLNGQEFLVAQGASYTSIADNTTAAIANATAYGESGYVGTSLQILSGTNGSTLHTRDGRPLTKSVDTGWAPASETISDIVTLWGLTDVGAIQADTMAVSVSFNSALYSTNQLQSGAVCLGSRDLKTGVWINAVDDNIVGGNKNFVFGPYSPSYGLGTWGIDPAGFAWAVVNGNNRDFAVVPTPTAPLPWDFDGNGDVNTADLLTLNKAILAHSTNSIYDLNNDGKVDSGDAQWLKLHYTHVGGK
jgi:hypothetical protein